MAPNRKLVGYAAVFGQKAKIGNFDEIIRKGAFSASLRTNPDILCLVDHDSARCIARTRSGTLTLSEDDKGLKYEISVPDTQEGRDLLVMAERGDLGGMSFGFTVPEDGERWQGNLRELMRVNLREVSVVHSWPAYKGTTVQARSKTPKLNKALMFLESVKWAY